jgi:predicted GNAT superfamily acetyltransferase
MSGIIVSVCMLIGRSLTLRKICAADFTAVLRINSQSSPGVGTLDVDELSRSVALASAAWVAIDATDIVGYVLAFSNSDAYDGEEFLAFRTRLNEPFLYIDQIAICADARNAGIASRMYAGLTQWAHELGKLTLCCGVNLRPPNPVSVKFHQGLGFEKIAEVETRDGLLVALLSKQLIP